MDSNAPKSPLPLIPFKRTERINLRKTVFDDGFLLRAGKHDVKSSINFRRLALNSLPGSCWIFFNIKAFITIFVYFSP